MAALSSSDIPGVILAGGQSRRMGGGDKALLALAGVTLVERVRARLAPQCGALALNANGDAARFAGLGLPVLADGIAGQPGPLAGVLAAMDWAAGLGAKAVVTAAADTPFLPADLVARLCLGGPGLMLAASPDATGAVQRHPTFGLWPVALRHDLRAALEGGVRKVTAWADGHGAGMVVFDSLPFDPFFNINTPDDLATATRLLAQA